MLPLFKWIYRRGVLAERSRIKRLLVEFSKTTQAIYPTPGEKLSDRRKRELDIQLAAQRVINDLLTPQQNFDARTPAPIDEDEHDPDQPHQH